MKVGQAGGYEFSVRIPGVTDSVEVVSLGIPGVTNSVEVVSVKNVHHTPVLENDRA